ncbi:MAG: C40 family peptidase [Oscillospiraceae bacterium]|nr:C40 family peptidase [Oscillospiraceae bacterium]
MANKTASGLVSFVKAKLGTPYVYGAKGEKLTLEKYNTLKKLYGSLVWASDKNKVGKTCTDCSGLISWYTGKVVNSTTYKNTATKVLTISKLSQAVPGCALWRQGHIGVYIGDGYCIEAKGSAYGVVKTKASQGGWTHILWLCDIGYGKTEAAPKVTYFPKCTYKGYSIVDALKSIKAQSSFTYRTKIAKANGIKAYLGTASQNSKLLFLLKEGKLIKP